MEFNRNIHKSILFIFILVLTANVSAQEPAGYYALGEGKNKAELKTALYNTIRNHTYLDYDISTSIWWYTYFKQTDWHKENYFWDMYSNNERSTYNGSLMNREHCMPRSWWGTSDNYSSFDSNGDLINLSPSDATANEAKSNFPLGEVGNSGFNNGVVKIGNSTFSGYTGTVFEPDDQYKGDFARTYMYMVTCYEDYKNNWRSLGTASMLYNNTYPTFKPYAVNLLLKWHRDDSVSDKEINRNNAVYNIQRNRNPYIDHPELAEFIWGSRVSELWTVGIGTAEKVASLYVRFDAATNLISVEITKPENATYFIQSINGIVLKTDKFSSEGTTSVAELKNGLYLLIVYSAAKRKVGKFVVSRSEFNQ